ncbi:MAG: DNA circularization N-terminal domain-containing protein [Rhizobiales bacterium]|nr:DNA circularization N-terminal domain-containing protein [Hyphomicrobiales bacterium]
MNNPLKFKRQARFNGLPFFMDKTSVDGGGRNVVTHQFPNGSGHLNEDLSPNVGKFKVSGYLIGFDAVAQANSLKAATSIAGTGVLTLPDLPFLHVRCVGFGYEISKDEINKVSINFDFVEEAGFVAIGISLLPGRMIELAMVGAGAALGAIA